MLCWKMSTMPASGRTSFRPPSRNTVAPDDEANECGVCGVRCVRCACAS
jgi:hypothetical protein